MKKVIEKIGGPWLFLIIVGLIYCVIASIDFQTVLAGIGSFFHLFIRILPTLAIVFGLLFFSNLLIDTKIVIRFLGRGSKGVSWLIAVVGGIISAGPIYLWFPLLSDLREKGMREGLIAVFLYNRAVKIPLIPMMILYFGIKTVVVLTIYMVLFSLLNGFAVEKIVRRIKRNTE